MTVMGPNYSNDLVDKIYNDVMDLLKKYNIQDVDPDKTYKSERVIRNIYLKHSLEMLVELQSWEDF